MITAATHVYGVMGYPVSHSLSPVMFNQAFTETAYNGVYVAFTVASHVDGAKAIRSLGIKGASITIPHKISILELMDELDPLAERIGAVNTVINQDGRLKGYNSDSLGAVNALEEATSLHDKQVTIIGAGGAARAVGSGVQSRGARLTIVNRTPSAGENLARDLNAGFIPLSDIRNLSCDILINTTSVGMTPHIHQSPVPSTLFTPDLLVMDIVYSPLKTLFLQYAENAGCQIIDGLSMFIHQAVFQFELWTGISAPRTVMKNAVMSVLNLSR